MYRLIFLLNAVVEGVPAFLSLLSHIQGKGFPLLFPTATSPDAELAAETAVLRMFVRFLQTASTITMKILIFSTTSILKPVMLTFAALPSLYVAFSPSLPRAAAKPVALGALGYHTFISLAALNRAVNVLPAIGPLTSEDQKAEWQVLGWSAVALHSGLAGAFVWVLRGGRSVPNRKER